MGMMFRQQDRGWQLLCLILTLGFTACLSTKNGYYSEQAKGWAANQVEENRVAEESLYLLGDAGDFDEELWQRNYVVEAAMNLLSTDRSLRTSVAYLGDNLYPEGLPKKEAEDRARGEAVLNMQLAIADFCNDDVFFIPGNHDWKKGKQGGRKAMLRQAKFLRNYKEAVNSRVQLYPDNACGDPKVVKINKDLVYLFVDSQWWLQNWDREKKMNKGCEVKSKGDFIDQLHEIFLEYKNDQIVLFLHHPPKSNGTHGGHFALKHHLFPIHEVHNLWIPMPGIGSVVPIYRKVTGSVQDIPNAKYQELLQAIDTIIKEVDAEVTFVSGHEHSLQYFQDNKLHYIVSGAASRLNYTQAGNDASYAQEERGFAVLRFYEMGESWVEFYTVDVKAKQNTPTLRFRKQIRGGRPEVQPVENTYPPIEKPDTLAAANPTFGMGKFGEAFLGEQYRKMWTTSVEMPFVDLETLLGGLKPIKKGGGMSSNSLRTEASDGKQYILRSVNKDYTRLLDPKYSDLALLDVLRDQNSASHPYGALLIPPLSDAAGVYTTYPELYWLKKQRGLGVYNDLFPEGPYLLEQRPSGDWSNSSLFGSSKKIISYTDLLEKLRSKKRYRIDQEWVLKSRLLDLLIHDWDRHDDQWRWALFEEEPYTVCRPIPRDRDQAFYKFEGAIPWYTSTFLMKKLKTMKGNLRDVKNQSFNARYFDRSFLNGLSWNQWEPIVEKMQKDVTDDVLYRAIEALPAEVRNQNLEVIALLKERRGHLMEIAKRLYDFLSLEVEVVGTDSPELFSIKQLGDGGLEIAVYSKQKGEWNDLRYRRRFSPKETKEVRLYGLRGKDRFVIEGEKRSKIRLRIVGGEQDDELVNNGVKGSVFAYDNLKGMDLEGAKVRDKRSDDLFVNEYNRRAFRYNTNFPFLVLGYTPDEGFWQGLSYRWTTYGWRKSPYKAWQRVAAAIAPSDASSFLFDYKGHFPHIWGGLDFAPEVLLTYPLNINYFGLGNNSENELREKEFNWVKNRSLELSPLFRLSAKNELAYLEFGPRFESIKILNSEGRVSDSNRLGFPDETFERRSYLGGRFSATIKSIDRESNPGNGFRFSVGTNYLNHTDSSDDLWEFDGDLTFYLLLFTKPRIVLANSVGAQHATGDLQFYQYPNLGNRSHLRGYRNERFRGETAFYENVDLRVSLLDWTNRYVPLDLGVLGGYDIGRVWLDGEDSDRWHDSATIGLWFDILSTILLQPYYTFNNEKDYFFFKMSFNF